MAVKIRLRRVGRKKQASYRIVVVDVEAPRDGAYVEAIGFYNPRRDPAELRMDLDRIDAWLSDGAQPTDTVASLIRKARKGGDDKVAFGTPAEGVKEAAAASEVVAEAGEEAEEAAREAETEKQAAEDSPEASAAIETPEETVEEAEAEAPAEEPEAEAETEAEADTEETKAAAASEPEPESEEEEAESSDEEEEAPAGEDEEEAPKA